MHIVRAAIVAGLLVGASDVAVLPDAEAGPAVVPFTIVSSGGSSRPIVTARFNGHPMPMMIHSNAGFFAQLRHGQATEFGVVLTGQHEAYGIDRPGHVSDLGLDRGVVARLAVGRHADANAPVVVFEVPQARLGMLGVGWISRNRVILDYAHKQAIIASTPTDAATRGQVLRRAGYVGLPMTYDDVERRFRVNATIDGVTRSMAVASASALTIDSEFARAAHLRSGRESNHGMGPTGTRVADHALAAPVRIAIGDWLSPPIGDATIMDTYGYSDQKRPADPERADGGDLGGAFLTTTGAVIDFGSRVLYVRRRPEPPLHSPRRAD